MGDIDAMERFAKGCEPNGCFNFLIFNATC